ncbi:MAG: hypothetical protein QOF33_3097 [Thermomicrobiales bacterium]|jgi:hypothetical protein|nr:hypothetical protein [Thermomicrobiales bacterium]
MIARIKGWFRSMSPQAFALGLAVVVVLVVLFLLVLTDTVGVPAAIITAAIPVTLGLVGQFMSSDRQNKREIEAKLRERKSEVYEGFIKFWMDTLVLKERREKLVRNQNQLVVEMNNFSKPMMLWASNEVVQAWADYRRYLNEYGESQTQEKGLENLVRFEKMLFLMREDMGHDPSGFRQYDLLSFFVNDIHKYVNQGTGTTSATG